MKISLIMYKQFLKLSSFCLLVAFVILIPSSAFSQDDIQDEQDLNSGNSSQNQPVERPGPTVGSSPWQNSAGATIGTRSDYSNPSGTGTGSAAATRANTLRPGGPTIDGRDPGGNPDVPFDRNMTLVFLTAAVTFALWVTKKRFSVKRSLQ
jgi:hypothetical protein